MTLPYGIAPPGHRLPAATRLGRVRLQVGDLDRSVTYYERVLGLRTRTRTAAMAVLGAGDDGPSIVELHTRPGTRPAPRRGVLGLFHFAILLPDRAALGRLVRHLGDIEVPAGMSDHLVSEAIYLQDPDNLGIEVYADRPREVWRHVGRELEMSTLPLDVRSIVAEAGDTPWTGAPAGTIVGHVHLHVGELGRASEFYHDALGFDRMVWSYPGALFLSAGGYHHHLGVNTWAAGAAPASEHDARLLEWEIVLPDETSVEATVKSMTAAGHPVYPDDAGWTAADPWGTPVRLLTQDARGSSRDSLRSRSEAA